MGAIQPVAASHDDRAVSGRRGADILATCGATEAYDPKTDIRFIWIRELQILGSTGYTQEDIERAFEIVAAGDAKPIISSVLDISEAREAHRQVEEREVIGKVVLTIPDPDE